MNVITNAALVLKDRHGNIGTVTSLTDNDIAKIHNAIADIGKLVDPVSHLPIKATATTVGVVQLADAEAIAAGTTGRVVDAKQLQDAVMGVTPANCVTNVATGSTANKIKVTKDGYTTTITIDNVEHAVSANSVQWDNILGKPSSFTPSSHTHDDRYYTESEIDTKLRGKANATDLANYLPITGALLPFAGSVIPDGYLLCNGAEISKSDYSKLYSVISNTYGTASSSDKFKLPDFRDRFLQGANSNLGTYLEAGLPIIRGTLYGVRGIDGFSSTLAFNSEKIVDAFFSSGTSYATHAYSITFNSGRDSYIYGKSTTVQPPALAVNILIKY